MSVTAIAQQTKAAAKLLGARKEEEKNKALKSISRALQERKEEIFSANKKDILRSEGENLAPPLLKRLKFQQEKLDQVCVGIDSLLSLSDPNGQVLKTRQLDEGLILEQVSCPIGVIGMIFESRPDALVQISTLCLKSGNGVILKGGSEAAETNKILTEIIHKASVEAGMPPHWISLVETREEVREMLDLDQSIDLLIPRGSNEFVKFIMKNTSIPVLGHADGITHAYVDSEADLSMAVDLIVDSKTQYVAVCNALETLLVHEDIKETFLPSLAEALQSRHVEIRGCQKTREVIDCKEATEEDWKTEYLDYILSIKVVASQEEAVNHIHQYGSGHTELIVTQNPIKAERFLEEVDSGDLFWNCSTRFSDGFRYGLGAEVGISTNKIHARGPVGMEGLMIYKWKLRGKGHIVSDYASGKKAFNHKDL